MRAMSSRPNRSGMEQVVQIDPDGDKTPTLGRERSFLEDLFGNIGTVGAPAHGGRRRPRRLHDSLHGFA